MNTEALKEEIKRELPGLLREDPAFRALILDLTRDEYAGRRETNDWFHQALDELRRDREEQSRKWERQEAEDRRKWDEQKAEDKRKWDEQKAEDKRRWDEQNLK